MHNVHMGSSPLSALAAPCQPISLNALIANQLNELLASGRFLANLKTSNLDAVARVGAS